MRALLMTALAAGPAAAQLPFDVDRLTDRVWVVQSATTVPAGARYVFLGDNRLVVSVPGAAPLIGTWAEDAAGLVITQAKVTSQIRVVELTGERLRMRVITPKTENDLTLVAAIRPPAPPAPVATAAATPPAPVVPVGSAYRCGADAFRVAFEGDKAYVTWPDNSTAVLTETAVPDAPKSRRTYTDGQVRVVEDTSEAYTRVLFARAGFRPRPCSPAR